MGIRQMTEEEFYIIRNNLEHFWGDRADTFKPLHHPMFWHSFGNTAFVVMENDSIAGYLLGFYSQKEPRAYVHMINVLSDYRGSGYGRKLYRHFAQRAVEKGCERIGAITSPANENSILFHRSLGMELLGMVNEQGVPVVEDYAGQGEHRVVFDMALADLK